MPKRRTPVVALGPVSAPVARSATQFGAPELVCRGLDVFGVWTFTADQRAYVILVGGLTLSWLQNLLERRRGRALIGVREHPRPGRGAL